MDWDKYWADLITEHRLSAMVRQLDAADEAMGFGAGYVEKTCKGVYENFTHKDYSEIKSNFLQLIDSIPNVHSIGSRVKNVDSLLVKIITKRAEKYTTKSPYVNLTKDDYGDIITDLIGIRLVLHYQGQWKSIHEQILKLFPDKDCREGVLLPHREGETFLAEPPIAYHAQGDDVSQYEGVIKAKLHEKGYRSNHYVISFENVYIELQVRTIYDEAWSDYDHTYVYKKEANPNNDALKLASPILCGLTNAASDMGELMREIYEELFKVDESGKFILDETTQQKIGMIKKRLQQSTEEFEQFCEDHISSLM